MTSKSGPSLQDLWNEAERQFSDLTRKSLRISPPKTLDDVRREIDSVQAQDKSTDKDRKRRAKDVALNALSCIKLLGGVAAQGAAMVFGPADLCFNAASILIEVPKKVHDFAETINGLFDEVSVFLSQFRIYQRVEQFSTIDPDLNDTIHKLMISFVTLCALAVNYQAGGKWKRFQNMTKKVLLDDDSGVQKELDNFKNLVQRQSQVRDTLTLEHVLKNEKDLAQLLNAACDTGKQLSELAKGMDILISSDTNRKLEAITQDQLRKIKEGLPVSDASVKASKGCYNEHWLESVGNSGAWLRSMDIYNEWFDRQSTSNPVLSLTGDANAGKSFLVSIIAHNLQSRYGEGSKGAARTLVIYHFFPRRTEKAAVKEENTRTGDNARPAGGSSENARSGELARPVETALKSLAYQIAEQDAAYAKTLAGLCESKEKSYFKDASSLELWTTLKFMHNRKDLTYFILFDGLDQLPDDSARQLFRILGDLTSLPEEDRSQVRILLTGQGKSFQENKSPPFPSIDIEQHNSEDITHYIDRELKKRDLLQDRLPEMVKLRDTILEQLPNVANGSFYKVQNALDQIEAVIQADGTSDDIQKILDRAGQDPKAIAQTVIEDLNQSLTAREIDEVNEMLIWVIFGRSWLTVEKLQAALFSYFRTAALQPLKQKIKGKYSKIFNIENNWVQIDDDLSDLITVPHRTNRSEEEQPKITATITITKADIKTVQNFLWELTENVMREKFPFDLSQAVTNSRRTIQVNEIDANLRMAQQTFKVLNDEPDERTKAIIPYMLERLPVHLEKLRTSTGQDELSKGEISALGRDLFAVLVDGEIIEKFWPSAETLPVSWFGAHRLLGYFVRWFDQPTAQAYLGKKDKEWINTVKKDASPVRALTRPIIMMIAEKWLRSRELPVGECWFWVRFYLAMPQEYDVDVESVADNDEDKPAEAAATGPGSETGGGYTEAEYWDGTVSEHEGDDGEKKQDRAGESVNDKEKVDGDDIGDKETDKDEDEDGDEDEGEDEDEDEDEEEEAAEDDDDEEKTSPTTPEEVPLLKSPVLENGVSPNMDQEEKRTHAPGVDGENLPDQPTTADQTEKEDEEKTSADGAEADAESHAEAAKSDVDKDDNDDPDKSHIPDDNLSLVSEYDEDKGEFARTITKAAKWVRKHFNIDEPDALFHERLGETYLWMLMYEEALMSFNLSLEKESGNYRSVRGRALALGNLDRLKEAITVMDEAIGLLKDIAKPDHKFEMDKLVDSYVSKADWHARCDEPKEAIKCFHAALEVKPEDYDILSKLLILLLKEKNSAEETNDLLIDLSGSKTTDDATLNQLSATLRVVCDEDDCDVYFAALFSMTRSHPTFKLVVDSLQRLIETARESDNTSYLANLLLFKGIAIYRYAETKDRNPERALMLWEECGCLNDALERNSTYRAREQAIRLIGSYHYHQARTSRNPRSHIDKMERLAEAGQNHGISDPYSKTYLGYYYSQSSESEKAKNLFMSSMRGALDLLSDDTEDNDCQGYYRLADVLMHYGDDLNALSAWSMLGPTDLGVSDSPVLDQTPLSRKTTINSIMSNDSVTSTLVQTITSEDSTTLAPIDTHTTVTTEPTSIAATNSPPPSDTGAAATESDAPIDIRSGDLYNRCDGRCGKHWTYANDFYCCKVCPDVQMCRDCLTLLQNGTLARFVCDAEHSWLHIPPWNDDEFTKGQVLTRGEFVDGARVGGTKVPIVDWLKGIAEEWGIHFEPVLLADAAKEKEKSNKKKKGRRKKKKALAAVTASGGSAVPDQRKTLDQIISPVEAPVNGIL